MIVLLVFSPVSDSRSSISFPLTSSAPSAGACPLWRCACEKRCAQIPFSITWAQTHTHQHTHTHTHTSTHIHMCTHNLCNHMLKQTCCYSLSVIPTDSYKRTQTGCDVQVQLYKSWISVPSAPVTRSARSSLFWCSVSLHLKTCPSFFWSQTWCLIAYCTCVLCVSIFGVCVCTYVSVFVCIYVYVHCEGCTQISSEETIMQPKAIFCQLKSWSQTQTLLQESWGALYMGDSQLLWNMLCWTFALNFSLSSYPSLLKAWAMGAYDEGPRPADLEHCFLRSVIAWAHWSFRA